jgi:hypothetical protein
MNFNFPGTKTHMNCSIIKLRVIWIVPHVNLDMMEPFQWRDELKSVLLAGTMSA